MARVLSIVSEPSAEVRDRRLAEVSDRMTGAGAWIAHAAAGHVDEAIAIEAATRLLFAAAGYLDMLDHRPR